MDGVVDYLSLVAGGGADLIVVTSLDGVFLYVSPVCDRLFGWDPAELEGRSEDDLVHPDDLRSLRAGRVEIGGRGSVTTSYRFKCRDGSYRWSEAAVRQVDVDGSVVVLSAVRDITERQQLNAALEQRAFTDPLTGVANRTVLMDRLRQALRRLDRASSTGLAVLYLDVDRFKVINDSLGHRIGDGVLLQIAERLTHHLRPADTLARLGGDEFVIVAEGFASASAAVELAERIIAAGREPFVVGEEEFVCTMSVGIASTADSQRDANELLHEADLALYRAKDRGRDRAEVFDEELRTKAVGRLATERMVRRAVDEGRLVVEYQPIIDLRSGGVVAAEALVRICDPDKGLLLPASFLEVAEESGLLITIDEHVLADALKQARAWQVRLGRRALSEVAINVTARHLADTGFQKAVIDHLDGHGVPHPALQIEVTERVLLEASNSAMTGLRALRDAGIGVGLDDFGTGCSSLAYLRQFPLDFVKLDKSFIDGLTRDESGRAIVAAVIGLSHALGLTVTAEGVETPEQVRVLEDLQCDRAQGFLFAASAAPDAINELVLARPGHRPRVGDD